MNQPDALLALVIRQARSLGIPLAAKIDPHVQINTRALRRFGRCLREGNYYRIELSARLLSGSEAACCTVLAHELLHTCYGCMNHGTRWKRYAARMQAAFGYPISCTTTDLALGTKAPAAKYIVRCTVCGKSIPRYRSSPLTRHPERYHCACGGTLSVTKEGSL